MADEEVALVAQNGRCPSHRQQCDDVEAAALCEEACGKEQGVSRQKREEDHAGLDEDDEENKAICGNRTCGNPASDGGTRIAQQLYDEIDKTHNGISPFCVDIQVKRAGWERVPARGSLWLLPPGPDQVRNIASPEPIQRARTSTIAER